MSPVTVHVSTEHSHKPRDCSVTAAKEIVTMMKQHATITRGTPSQILADTAVDVVVDVRVALG